MHIVHVIVGLETGGAESMLKRLVLASQDQAHYRHSVVSLTDIGVVGAELRGRGVDVRALGMRSVLRFPAVAWRLATVLRELRPTIVQTWMYHADFLGGLVGRLLGYPVVWGIRSTGIPQGPASVTWWLVRINALCSGFIPQRIVCCAETARRAHAALGFSETRMCVIPNGYDFSMFDRLGPAREAMRARWGFGAPDIVVGAVGRFDALKDFPNFIAAARGVAQACPQARFLLVGRGLDGGNRQLARWIADAGLADRFTLAGEQSPVGPSLAAMDVFCLSSRQEAFPNVVVEAMAAALPCVVTDAGDAAAIVGDCGWVVPVQDPEALARSLLQVCALDPGQRGALGVRAARRVRSRYDIQPIRSRYESVYDAVAPRHP